MVLFLLSEIFHYYFLDSIFLDVQIWSFLSLTEYLTNIFQTPILARLVTSHVSSASRFPSLLSYVIRASTASSCQRTRSSPRVKRRIRARCPSSRTSMIKPSSVQRLQASQLRYGVLAWLCGFLAPSSWNQTHILNNLVYSLELQWKWCHFGIILNKLSQFLELCMFFACIYFQMYIPTNIWKWFSIIMS